MGFHMTRNVLALIALLAVGAPASAASGQDRAVVSTGDSTFADVLRKELAAGRNIHIRSTSIESLSSWKVARLVRVERDFFVITGVDGFPNTFRIALSKIIEIHTIDRPKDRIAEGVVIE